MPGRNDSRGQSRRYRKTSRVSRSLLEPVRDRIASKSNQKMNYVVLRMKCRMSEQRGEHELAAEKKVFVCFVL